MSGGNSPPYSSQSFARNQIIHKLKRVTKQANIINCRTAGLATGNNFCVPTADGATDSSASYFAFGTLTHNGTKPTDSDTVTIGGKVYTFKDTLSNTDGFVWINGSANNAIANLMLAITLGAGAGTNYAAATTANTSITATNPTTSTLLMTALVAGLGSGGTSGASTTTTKSITPAWTISGATLAINKVKLSMLNSANPTLFRVSGGRPFSSGAGFKNVSSIIAPCTSTLTSNGTDLSDGNTITIGTLVLTARNSPSLSTEFQIAGTAAGTLTNIFNKVNSLSTQVTATNPTGTTMIVTTIAQTQSIATTKVTTPAWSWSLATTQGGGGSVQGNLGNLDGTNAIVHRVEFMTDSLALSIGVIPTTAPYRFIVDGRYLDLVGTVTTPTSGSTTTYITLPFPVRAKRKIIVECQSAAGFDDVKLGPTEKVWQTDGDDIIHAHYLIDSYGANDAVALGDGLVLQLADYLGIRDMVVGGSGGTGWGTAGAPSAYNYGQRIAQGDTSFQITFGAASAAATSITATVPSSITCIPNGWYITSANHVVNVTGGNLVTSGSATLTINSLGVAVAAGETAYPYLYQPDVIFLHASYNDRSSTAATVQANALAGMQDVRAKNPNAFIMVYGCFPGSQGPAGGITTNSETPVAAAFAQFADNFSAYAPISNDPNGAWITGTGNVGAPTGTGNADILVNADAVHLQDSAGLQYAAIRKAEAFTAALGAF